MSTTVKIGKDETCPAVDQTLYRAMIESLLYLTASRSDLCLSVGVCARFQGNPKLFHLNAVKRIIKYVKGTLDYGLYYSKNSNQNLVGFCDADWAGSIDDRRSTSGGCFFLGNNLILWHSKKQNCVSLSTTEAEYIAMGSCCTQLFWMKQMLADYGMTSNQLLVFCGNEVQLIFLKIQFSILVLNTLTLGITSFVSWLKLELLGSIMLPLRNSLLIFSLNL